MSTLPNPHEKGHTPFMILSHAMTRVHMGIHTSNNYAEAEGYRDAWMILYNRLTWIHTNRKERILIRTSKKNYVIQN